MVYTDYELTYIPEIHYALRGRLTLSTEVLTNVLKDKKVEELQQQVQSWIDGYADNFVVSAKAEGYGRITFFIVPTIANPDTPQWKVEVKQAYLQNTVIELYELDTDMHGEFKIVGV